MPQRILTALPVYNEATHVRDVLAEVRRYSREVLVVDDGSTDGTRELLARQPGIQLLTHETNRGYGAALKSAFDYAVRNRYDVLVTIDCDGQHEPQRIPRFVVAACKGWDIVSGSRYLQAIPGRRRAARRSPANQPANHGRAEPAAGPEPDRRLLRVQGLSRRGAETARTHRAGLRHAAGAVGAGGQGRSEDSRVARAARFIWI